MSKVKHKEAVKAYNQRKWEVVVSLGRHLGQCDRFVPGQLAVSNEHNLRADRHQALAQLPLDGPHDRGLLCCPITEWDQGTRARLDRDVLVIITLRIIGGRWAGKRLSPL
jgi:hypothetical protein